MAAAVITMRARIKKGSDRGLLQSKQLPHRVDLSVLYSYVAVWTYVVFIIGLLLFCFVVWVVLFHCISLVVLVG